MERKKLVGNVFEESRMSRQVPKLGLRDRSLFIAWGGVGGFWAKHDEI